MAAKKTTEPYDNLDDETQYSVSLLKPVQIGRSWARPGEKIAMKGKVIKEKADVVGTVQPLTD